MGATGAGKSTLAKCISRSIPQFQPGRLTRRDRGARPRRRDRDGVGSRRQRRAGVAGLRGAALLHRRCATRWRSAWSSSASRVTEMRERLAEALSVVGLTGFDGRDPITLSGGEKQRLAIAAVLALEPAVLVFDEPTTDLDPLGKSEVFAVLAAVRDARRDDPAGRARDRRGGTRRPPGADGRRAHRRGRRAAGAARRRRPPRAHRRAPARPRSPDPGARLDGAPRRRRRRGRSPRGASRAGAGAAAGDCGTAHRGARPRARLHARAPRPARRVGVHRERRVRRPHRAERLGEDDAREVPERAPHAAARQRAACAAWISRRCRWRASPPRWATSSRIPTSRSLPRRCARRSAFALAQLRRAGRGGGAPRRPTCSTRSGSRAARTSIRFCSARASASGSPWRRCSSSSRRR